MKNQNRKSKYMVISEDDHNTLLPQIFLYIFVVYTLYIQFRIIEFPRGVTILGAVTLGVSLIHMVCNRNTYEDIGISDIKLLGLFYAVTFFTGAIDSPNVSSHFGRWMESFLYFLIIVAMVYVANNRKNLEILILFFCVFFFVCAITLIVDPVLYKETSIARNIRYSLSPSLNVNTLGTCFTLGSWCMLYFMSLKKRTKAVGLAYIGIMLYAIDLTGSRKNFLALGLMIVLWILLVYLPEHKRNQIPSIILTISITVVICYVARRIFQGSLMSLRLQDLWIRLTEDSEDYSRIIMYKNAWNLFKSHPLTGVGFNGYAYYYGGYSHATYTEVLACTGIVGTFLYFEVYIYSICNTVVKLKTYAFDKNNESCRLMLKMALILWGALAFLAIGIIHIYVLTSFICFGVLFAVLRNAEQDIKRNNGIIYIDNKQENNSHRYIR